MDYDPLLARPRSPIWYKKANKDIDKLLKRAKGYVDLEDMNNAFIKDHTKGTGLSVALNMQNNDGQETQVMVRS